MSRRKLQQIKTIIINTSVDKNLLKFARNIARRGIYRLFPKRFKMPWPTTLMLELTNKCNLHCITCPREYDYGKELIPGDMTFELAKEIIDDSYPYLQSIGLTGMGETLFAPNLLEVAKYVKEKKKSIVTFISTNANFPGFIDKITPVLPYIDTIQISADGVGEAYENIRHGASFEMLDQHLSQLIPLTANHTISVMFNMVVNRRNYKSMHELIEYAAQKGVKYVNFNYINLASVTAIPASYYQFFKSPAFEEEKTKAREAANRHPEIEVTGIEFHSCSSLKQCPLLYNQFQINYDGEVPPCCAKPFTKQYSYGNVKQSNIKEILNGPSARQFRNTIFNGATPEFCQKCHIINL